MKKNALKNGSVLIIVVFVISLLTVAVMGMLQINAEEVQLMQNQVYAAEAQATAEAGLNDALAQIRNNSGWSSGFTDKSFNNGLYTVTVNDTTITSTGTSEKGYVARVEADFTVSDSGPPYLIQIDALRINE